MERRSAVMFLVASIACAGCVGGRVGYRHGTGGGVSSGPYGGMFLRGHSFGSDAPAPGGEAQVMWAREGRFGVLGPSMALLGDPDTSVLGGIVSVGLEVGARTRLHLSGCLQATYSVPQFGACVRWTPGRWWGVDGEIALPLLLADATSMTIENY
jgi:hypothetical protein